MSEPPAEYIVDPTWRLHRDGYDTLLKEHVALTDRVAHLVVTVNRLQGEITMLRAAVLGFTDPLIDDAYIAASKAAYSQMAQVDTP